MSISRILGVGIGLSLGFCALLYLLFSMGHYLNEPGVSHRKLGCVIATFPFLVTVWIVFACFLSEDRSCGKALLYTILAELGLCVVLALFLWWLTSSWQKLSHSEAGAALTEWVGNGVWKL